MGQLLVPGLRRIKNIQILGVVGDDGEERFLELSVDKPDMRFSSASGTQVG
jgi:hypothetical protein